MAPEDILLTFAEVSVALAGFIGITAAFRRNQKSWSGHDLLSVRFVLEVSFAALFLSVLPGLLTNLALDAAVSWRVAAALMSVVLLALYAYQARRRGRMARAGEMRRGIRGRPFFLATYLVISVAIGAASLLNLAVPGAYLLGVAMLLVAAAIEFLSFVAVLQS